MSRPTPENLVGITVCVNYADKLGPAMKHNMKFFKKLYVVTDPNDIDTFDVIKDYKNVELILNPNSKAKGATFNKSGLMRAGQEKAHQENPQAWCVVIDADTLLPPNFWQIMDKHGTFSKDICYLLKRKMYRTPEDLQNDIVCRTQYGCGFFQLYVDKTRLYPSFSKSAGICDIIFQQGFRKRTIELDGYCTHLGDAGHDWDGRVSPQWA